MSDPVRQAVRRACVVTVAALAAATAMVSAAGARNRAVVRFATAGAPSFLAIVGGHVWVAAHRGGALYELDPRTDKIVRTTQTGDDICDLAVSGVYLEVGTGCVPGQESVVDTRNGKVVRQLRNGAVIDTWGGSAWRWTSDGISRLDLKSHVVLKHFRIRSVEGPPVEAGGSLWFPSDAWVTRIALATNSETVIPLPGSEQQAAPDQGYAIASHLAVTPGKVWIGNPAGVYWVDEATGKATRVPGTRVGNLDQFGNIGIYAGEGGVFARTGPSTVSRIDPGTGAVVGHYPAAGGGGDVAVGFGSLWVTNFGIDSTWRLPLA